MFVIVGAGVWTSDGTERGAEAHLQRLWEQSGREHPQARERDGRQVLQSLRQSHRGGTDGLQHRHGSQETPAGRESLLQSPREDHQRRKEAIEIRYRFVR